MSPLKSLKHDVNYDKNKTVISIIDLKLFLMS